MSNNTLNNNFRRYEILVTIWKRWDESYWTSFNIFVIVTGLLIAGFSQLGQDDVLLKSIFCLAGVVISIIWLFTLNRKFVHLTCCEVEGRKLEGAIYQGTTNKYGAYTSIKKFAKPETDEDKTYMGEIQKILGFKKYFARFGTGTLIACWFPIIIILVWVFLDMLGSGIFLLVSIVVILIVLNLYEKFRSN